MQQGEESFEERHSYNMSWIAFLICGHSVDDEINEQENLLLCNDLVNIFLRSSIERVGD